MDPNKIWLKYLLFIAIGSVILFATIFSYVQYENIKFQLIKTDREHTVDLINSELDEKEQILNLIGANVKSFYESSEFVTADEYEQFMKGVLVQIPEIKNIFVLNGSMIVESYPDKNFKNFDFNDIFTSIPVIIDDQKVGTIAVPIDKELIMVLAIPFEYLNIEGIIPQNIFKLIVYAQDRTFTLLEIESDGTKIQTQNIEFTKEQLDNSVHVQRNTTLFSFKTQQPITLEYILWYVPSENSFLYFEIGTLFIGIFLSIFIPFLLFRAEKFNTFLKRQRIKLQKSNDDIKTSNEFLTKTQKLLLKSEEKFRNLYNLSPYAILVIDLSGKIESYNEKFQHLFQYSSDELIGKPFSVVVSDKGQEIAQKYFEELQKSGELKDRKNWLKKKDGTEFPVLFSSSSIMNSSAKTNGYMNIILDQSEAYQVKELEHKYNELLKEKLDTLKTIDKQKGEFASMVSHELKTPLFPIKFHAKMLNDPEFGELNQKQKESVNQIYHNAVQLERLIGDLLDAQRIELGTMKFKFSEIRLDKMMEEIYDEHQIYMQEKNISFTNTTSDEHTFKSDPDRIKQVFSNLIKNAVDFVHDGDGKIEIGATREDDSVLFYVKDNGIGIRKEKQEDLFKKFYQIDTSATRRHGGTGLGLSICKGIVVGLGGKIWVESMPQKGTTFFFSTPNSVK
ncbi:PAS domain-containing sensor histidine kinase [Nitrosopumilus sp. S4]